MSFRDRHDAGVRLAERLEHLRGRDLVVLGLPRGGVPVAAEVATALAAPLDVIVVRKLGAPRHAEYAIGAIAETGERVLDEGAMRSIGVTEAELAAIERREQAELTRRAALYRRGRPRRDLTGRTAVIVDDGIATGATATAACRAARALGASAVVLAVPVAPRNWADLLRNEADELIAVETHSPFHAVGLWYTDFGQTSDEEVVALLEER